MSKENIIQEFRLKIQMKQVEYKLISLRKYNKMSLNVLCNSKLYWVF